MIEYDFDESPMDAGDTRGLRVWGEQPLTVRIECFRQPPRPPKLQACAECGSFPVFPGASTTITAPAEAFEEIGGFLRIMLLDGSGEVRMIEIIVRERHRPIDRPSSLPM